MKELEVYDKLDQIMITQRKFTDRIYNQYKNQHFSCYNFNRSRFDIWYSLVRASTEIHEASELIHSKIWSQNIKEFNREKMLEEIVDCQKFLNQAILLLGFTAQDVYDMHMKKDKINIQRQENNY